MQQLKRRLPLLLVLAIGAFVWKGGFGVLATERTLTWRLPVPAADVRSVELQLFQGDTLLKREELSFPAGLTSELQTRIPLTGGSHRALMWVQLKDAPERRFWKREFDPENEPSIVITP